MHQLSFQGNGFLTLQALNRTQVEVHKAVPAAEAPRAPPRCLHPAPPEYLHMPTLPAVTIGRFGTIESSVAVTGQLEFVLLV